LHGRPDLDDRSGNLVAEGGFLIRLVRVQVQVGAANTAGINTDSDIERSEFTPGDTLQADITILLKSRQDEG
jgi:hypothetical protein